MERRLEDWEGALWKRPPLCPAPPTSPHCQLASVSIAFSSALFPPPCLDPGGGAEAAARPATSPASVQSGGAPA